MGQKIMTIATTVNTFAKIGVTCISELPWWATATINMLNALMTILLVVSGVAAGVLLTWRIVCWYKADDNERPAEKKKIIIVVVGAVGVIVAESVLKWVLSFYANPGV